MTGCAVSYERAADVHFCGTFVALLEGRPCSPANGRRMQSRTVKNSPMQKTFCVFDRNKRIPPTARWEMRPFLFSLLTKRKTWFIIQNTVL